MKTVKLLLVLIAVTAVGTMSYAGTNLSKVVIQEKSEQRVNLKTSLDDNETMVVVITNEDGEVVLSDEITDTPAIVNKTYDFNSARFGAYTIEVFLNDEQIEATVVGEGRVTIQELYSLEVY